MEKISETEKMILEIESFDAWMEEFDKKVLDECGVDLNGSSL